MVRNDTVTEWWKNNHKSLPSVLCIGHPKIFYYRSCLLPFNASIVLTKKHTFYLYFSWRYVCIRKSQILHLSYKKYYLLYYEHENSLNGVTIIESKHNINMLFLHSIFTLSVHYLVTRFICEILFASLFFHIYIKIIPLEKCR